MCAPTLERVEQPDRLLEQVGRAAAADTTRWSIGGITLWIASIVASRLSWASITPFGVPVVPEVKIEVPDVLGPAGAPRGEPRLPVSRDGRRRAARRVSSSTVVVGNAARPASERVGRIAAGAEREVPRLGTADDARDRLEAHPQVQRDEHQPGAHRAEVHGRQGGRGRGPGQHPVAGLQPECPEAPRGDAASALELGIGPVDPRSVLGRAG